MYKLIVDDLHKKFDENEVLKGVSLKAKAGDVISLIGSSGSGKSTFLRCINFLESPCSGRIMLNGEEIRTSADRGGALRVSDPKQLQKMRTCLSMVFQHFNLWAHMTVLENIVEAPVSVPGLNRGEAEARALAMEPEVMLFDEPTSALDPELVGEVLKVMQKLAEEGRTMIVVTHEMGFARNVSNHVVFLHKGKIEEQGDPREVLNAPRSERLQQFLAGRLK
ncbi:ABC transporter ATP-binding protein [Paraburkholderia heleia]|uniref:ABC transporter ATP-binding protein n=1 Tax=Paraburkholderia heleia TaxID=634127 RepID=UPI0005A806AD|nr:ATP-binding cassette domain-containing protein [Paraburkholderia heleia]